MICWFEKWWCWINSCDRGENMLWTSHCFSMSFHAPELVEKFIASEANVASTKAVWLAENFNVGASLSKANKTASMNNTLRTRFSKAFTNLASMNTLQIAVSSLSSSQTWSVNSCDERLELGTCARAAGQKPLRLYFEQSWASWWDVKIRYRLRRFQLSSCNSRSCISGSCHWKGGVYWRLTLPWSSKVVENQ